MLFERNVVQSAAGLRACKSAATTLKSDGLHFALSEWKTAATCQEISERGTTFALTHRHGSTLTDTTPGRSWISNVSCWHGANVLCVSGASAAFVWDFRGSSISMVRGMCYHVPGHIRPMPDYREQRRTI